MKMIKHRLRALHGIAILTLALAAPPTLAQEDAFGEVIDVRVVNLEVVVTENGQRVTGLGPEDFLLTVDGREVAIEYFTEVSGGTAVLRSDEGSGATVPALAPGVPVATSYLVFIDEYFSLPTDRNRLLKRMTDQLPFLSPEDRMAVVAYNGKQVEMLSTWSQSVTALERVFQQALDRRAYGLSRRAEQRLYESTRDVRNDALDPIESNEEPALSTDLEIDERFRAEEIAVQVKRVVLAASSALRSFANPPGRKVMLLLSGGWPYNPGQWVIRDPQRYIYANTLDSGDELYRPLIETANRLSYTLYPIDVPGLDADSEFGADRSAADRDFTQVRFNDREREEETTLYSLARETGGRALVDGAGSSALQRVYEDSRSYYWIGFTPDWQGDDAAHKVKVKPRRKGLKMRSRQGFSDLSRETEVSMMVESALLFGNPPGASPLVAAIGPGKRAGRGKLAVPLKIVIPLDGLTFLPVEDGFLADTELRVAVLDEDGNTSDIPVIPLGFKVDEPPKEGRFTAYETNMKVRRKKHDLVVSIYDKPSGRILSTKLAIDPAVEKR